ncbi:hypothetical protein BV898_19068 [Hypsibius exemplaris]|uniref:G-protein coupled receptors family 1 profile domain-containing protein n=1 Tax=Hypsibius exemplaris TaxID=2072580 RepID=A0A9X6NRF9_HYPEX|nr:hypothetical protein BV898_19068 [Hypsibius exemplaris]
MNKVAVRSDHTVLQGGSILHNQTIVFLHSTFAGALRAFNHTPITRPRPNYSTQLLDLLRTQSCTLAARKKRSGLILLGVMSMCALVSWAPINGAGFVVTLIPDYTTPDYAYEAFMAMDAFHNLKMRLLHIL